MTETKIIGLVLTFNEEINIVECMKSLSFCNKIMVFDSLSTDQTKELVLSFGADFLERKFDNYSNQRNAAIQSIPEDFDWILMIDADERIPLNLQKEIREVITTNSPVSMCLVRRKDVFLNKWLKHSSGYPTWFPRIFKNGDIVVEREINEEYTTTGEKKYLTNHLIHYPFNKGIKSWLKRHNEYSTMESSVLLKEYLDPIQWKYSLSKDPTLRRKFQKQLIYHLPFRPIIIFFIFYFVKGGFLDGKAGYNFCRLRYVYEIMIDTKIQEIKAEKNVENFDSNGLLQ